MQVKRAIAAAAGTVLGVTMIGIGPAFADGGHHHARHSDEDRSCSSTHTSEHDRDWLKSAVQGDYFEITGGHMAQDRGVDAMTKALGVRLYTDHTMSLQETKALAAQLDVTTPNDMSEKEHHELDDVAKDGWLHFDDEYAELEIRDHHTDISEAKDEWEDGCNMAVRQMAHSEIPMLEEHLSLSEQTHRHIETLPGHESDSPSAATTRHGDDD